MKANETVIQYLPVTTVISLLVGAVWINSNLGSMRLGVSRLEGKFDHATEMQNLRMDAHSARFDALEAAEAQRDGIRSWIIEFRALNPEMTMPENP